jgi:alpha-1,3-mannosyltransferase
MHPFLTWIVKPRSLPFLILGLIFFALFLSLGSYDQFSTSFQLPPPPVAQLSTTEILLQQQLDSLREKLVEVCPEVPEPIYAKPLLTVSQQERYRHLQNLGGGIKQYDSRYTPGTEEKRAPGRRKRGSRYMLTTTIRQIQDQLPDLLNTILVLTMFLGPDKLSFSILEGPSSDCTPDVLEQVLHPLLMSLGVPASSIRLKTREQKIDFDQHNRIEVLAGLRNKAIEPLWEDRNGVGRDIGAVVFFNDVYMKARDVLELLHQHVKAEEESGQETGITSGWDWYERSPAHYYDVWVGRTVRTCSALE